MITTNASSIYKTDEKIRTCKNVTRSKTLFIITVCGDSQFPLHSSAKAKRKKKE